MVQHFADMYADKGVDEAIERAAEYQLNDSTRYFFERAADILSAAYQPTEQDSLRARVRTTGTASRVERVPLGAPPPLSPPQGLASAHMALGCAAPGRRPHRAQLKPTPPHPPTHPPALRGRDSPRAHGAART